MAKPRKKPTSPTSKEVAEALVKAKGIISLAAQVLGCSRTTVVNRINESPALQGVQAEAKEGMKDFAESKLYNFIARENLSAVTFFLSRQARDRGYGDKLEVAGQRGTVFGLAIMDDGEPEIPSVPVPAPENQEPTA